MVILPLLASALLFIGCSRKAEGNQPISAQDNKKSPAKQESPHEEEKPIETPSFNMQEAVLGDTYVEMWMVLSKLGQMPTKGVIYPYMMLQVSQVLDDGIIAKSPQPSNTETVYIKSEQDFVDGQLILDRGYVVYTGIAKFNTYAGGVISKMGFRMLNPEESKAVETRKLEANMEQQPNAPGNPGAK